MADGRRLGPDRLIRELGHGGMGAVYLAARDDQEYESDIAIKVVRQGLDSDFILHRFRASDRFSLDSTTRTSRSSSTEAPPKTAAHTS